MGWKQFFVPVQSMNVDEAKALMNEAKRDGFQLVDVRQPAEYEAGHLPGAQLMPLADLGDRSGELDPEKPTLVYCAIGGRSRVAAQMLAAKGFTSVINMSGGIKAWTSGTAVGPEDSGLDLFSGKEALPETLSVAYGLETALQEFYESMVKRVERHDVRDLFGLLAAIESRHRQRIADRYRQLPDKPADREELTAQTAADVLEGGLTTSEYLQRYQPDLESVDDVLGLAMAIEAQALDLYQRGADRAATPDIHEALTALAAEEREHIRRLGELIGTTTAKRGR